MELAVFTGTAVLILVQPAQEVVSSSRVASLNVIWSFCFIFPPFFSNSTGWGRWGNQEAKEVQNQLAQASNGPAPTQAATSQAATSQAATSQAATSQAATSQAATSQAATSHPTGCAAAGYRGCCTGDNCKTDSGCYCDVRCYYFHNCCDDITSIGCYRKCAAYSSCVGFLRC